MAMLGSFVWVIFERSEGNPMFFKSKRKSKWQAGDAPPVGSYLCATCCSDYSLPFIRRDGQKLPLCPCCGGDEWFAI